MIVLDASGSMWGQIEGVSKIEIARDVLGEVLENVPEARELGLVVYGHRRKGDCADIELAVPAATGTGAAIVDFADGISPKGKTPLSDAVLLAAERLRYTEDAATVILVTDGLETCEKDPCALGRQLAETGVDFTAHVVGFGLSQEDGAKVACLAEETGGRYFEAEDAGGLNDALTETVVAEGGGDKAEEPKEDPGAMSVNLRITAALSEEGPEMTEVEVEPRWQIYAAGPDGQAEGERILNLYDPGVETLLPVGDYVVQLDFANAVSMAIPVRIEDGKLTEQHIVLNVGHIEVTPKRSADDAEAENAMRVQVFSGEARNSSYGKSAFFMPAGDVRVLVTHAKAQSEQIVKLKAGARQQIEVILGTGVIVPRALYAEGGPSVDTNDVRFIVLEDKMDLNGDRKQVASVYGSNPIDAPSGRYVLLARLGRAEVIGAPFEVEAASRVEPLVVLNAGVVALSAPGAYRVWVYEGKTDINGNRKQVESAYGESQQWTLSAGKYIAQVSYEDRDDKAEMPFEVTAGERVEVTVTAP